MSNIDKLAFLLLKSQEDWWKNNHYISKNHHLRAEVTIVRLTAFFMSVTFLCYKIYCKVLKLNPMWSLISEEILYLWPSLNDFPPEGVYQPVRRHDNWSVRQAVFLTTAGRLLLQIEDVLAR